VGTAVGGTAIVDLRPGGDIVMDRMAATPRTAERVSDSKGLEWAVRGGLVCYGLVHLLIAWLALSLVFGDRSGSPDQQGALTQLAQNPLGATLLWAVAVGFVALVIWQALEARRAWQRDDKAQKVAIAVGQAVVYAALAITAARIAMGDRSSSNVDQWTRDLMKLPLGELIVGAVGLAIIGIGAGQWVIGAKRKFTKDLKQSAAGDSGSVVIRLGQVGFIARGVALGVVGALFVWAATTFDPKKAGGLDVALRTLLEQSYGGWLLGAVAVGIGCFGVFCLFWARDVDPSN
jgi:hypothetical protein